MERGRQRVCLDEEMHRREREKMCLDRGSELLEELIAFCNGRSNPIRNFSLNQLQKAIDDCQPLETLKYLKDRDMKWYNGILERRRVFIKIFTRCTKEVYRDIVVSSQMSSHNNVLKVLGYCLEIPAGPALVFEYPENGCLRTHIYAGSLPWGIRMKIAKEIANAVTYLHTAFPRTIIHRDIKPENIFLNQNYSPKLSNFYLSISIPEGESQVEDQDRVNEVVDPGIRGNGGEGIDQQQQQAFLEVALRCTNPFSREDRPLMIEVAKELQRIERSITAAAP
ncbi:hypothetical protein OIU78_012972 [Salix suchowensis]|nr:hypothetical protein OIU78_012972 [Salix suchowensis]